MTTDPFSSQLQPLNAHPSTTHPPTTTITNPPSSQLQPHSSIHPKPTYRDSLFKNLNIGKTPQSFTPNLNIISLPKDSTKITHSHPDILPPSSCPPQSQESPIKSIEISLPSSLQSSLKEKWQEAMIFQTFGYAYEFHYLQSQLLKLWKLKRTPTIFHLGLNFYLVANLLQEDRIKILTSTPWFLGSLPLLVRQWVPHFSPSLTYNYPHYNIMDHATISSYRILITGNIYNNQ